MAKIQELSSISNFEPPKEDSSLGTPVEELKGRDCSAVSMALLHKGEFSLLHGDKGGLKYFEMAAKLDPSNSHLFLQQGLALFEYGSQEGREEGLTLASKRFKMATTLDPSCFQAWHLWGNTLYFLGNRQKEPSYFAHALKKYEKAVTLSEGQPPDVLADLYWDLGDLWEKLATLSGEATDYYYAIQAYEKGSSYQDDLPPEFWMNFGKVYALMGEKTNDVRLFIKAINCYKNAISITLSNRDAWILLGKTLQTLYGFSHDEDHFSQANECFKTAAQLSSKESQIWLDWAHLLLESGKVFRDEKKLLASIDKCYKAHRYDRKNPHVIATWTHALAELGITTGKLKPIHEAFNKIEPLVEKFEDPEIYYAYGMAFYAQGHYYKDIDAYYQAIELFQEGLSMDRTHTPLWEAIGDASFAAAQMDMDERSFDRTCHFFERALNLRKQSTTHSRYGMTLLKYGELKNDQKTFELAAYHFEMAINMQKNAAYLHPDWMFAYAVALDHIAEFLDSDTHYIKALDILSHILMLKPDYPSIHHQLALTCGHYGELIHEPDTFARAIHHYRIAHQQDKENDQVILDWALTLTALGDLLENDVESDQYLREAEYKMIQAAKLGNIHAYYSLSCLYSVIGDLNNSLRFLEKAKAFGALPPLEVLIEDDWLDNLRETEGFSQFQAELESLPEQ
ncbi:hypothetical protein [Candidatus Neptunochlamydia vexilliferae]|uniref:Uncharacterized protein n=1 Tax=Candidatus Neptunichlamydia vexilliferae TaxID=1651774 RepID=A0ABS0AYT4_9BACT|nr:hypothetical protein [Candidatus Neptunochlamydia vexilliferae]MBF5058641.1 hypothetical protein [Candidatus Neptunochlamydia vexilliferae]